MTEVVVLEFQLVFFTLQGLDKIPSPLADGASEACED